MKENYLNSLKEALEREKLSSDSIEEIVNDFNEIFDAGLEQGLTEEEIIEKLGDLDKMVKDISSDETCEEEGIDSEFDFEVFNDKLDEKLKKIERKIGKKISGLGKLSGLSKIGKVMSNSFNFNYNSSSEVESKKEEININDSKKLVLKIAPSNVPLTIKVSKDNTFYVETPKESDGCKISREEFEGFENIDIQYTSQKLIKNFLKVYIPEINGLELIVNGGNGPIALNGVNGDKLDFISKNGPIAIKVIKFNQANIQIGNGPLTLKDIDVDEFNVTAGNGPVTTKDIKAEYVKISLGSGPFTVKNIKAKEVNLERKGFGPGVIKDIDCDKIYGNVNKSDFILSMKNINAKVNELK